MSLLVSHSDTTELVPTRSIFVSASAPNEQNEPTVDVTDAGILYMAALRYLEADAKWEAAYDLTDRLNDLAEADAALIEAAETYFGWILDFAQGPHPECRCDALRKYAYTVVLR